MFTEISHPLIESTMAVLRDQSCPSAPFRRAVRRVATLMVPAVTADFATDPVDVTTPLEVTPGKKLSRPVLFVPILRAGLGFLDGFLDVVPDAVVAHLGLKRCEETLLPVSYYQNLPPGLDRYEIVVLDPMLATGGSAVEAVRELRKAGATRIRFACLVAAPEGVAAMEKQCPDVPVFAAALDRCLNEKGYILPGLGDAGDRLFGT